jgi:hypothetical protein
MSQFLQIDVMRIFVVISCAHHITGNGTQPPLWPHPLSDNGKDLRIMPSPFTHGVIPKDKGQIQFAEGSWNLIIHWNMMPTERLILLMRNALENITHHGGHLNETSFNTSYWNAMSALDLTN